MNEQKTQNPAAGGQRRQNPAVRRRLALLLCLCLLITLAPQMIPGAWTDSAYGTTESSALRKRAELVVFIRFKGEKEFVSGTTSNPVVTLLDGSQIDLNDWYNAQNAEDYAENPSLNQFVQKVSYNGILAKPIYTSASSDNTKMVSYECDTKAGDADFDNDGWYQGVQREALKAVAASVPKDANLDYDNNGTIDNCMFLWGPTKSNAFFYYMSLGDGSQNHQWNMSPKDVTINGKKPSSYTRNFIYSKININAIGVGFNKAAMVHEYMHTLGVPDLYSNDDWYTALIGSSTLPVGDWDIQSDHKEYGSTFLSQRIRYFKAGTFGEITESGTYTLYDVNDPNPANGINGYKIPTSRDNEYFVIEYRRGATDGAAAKHGDGILVYRVKSDTRGNVEGDKEVHLYGRVAGFNDTASMANSSEGIGDSPGTIASVRNDLEFTDGTNSGIRIRNIGKAGETINFEVVLP